MGLRAEIRSLKRRLPAQPWLFARLADLLRREGREGEALDLLREGVARYPAYSSGWQKLGELQSDQGRQAEALRAWERCTEGVSGICAAWISRLDAARVDPERHLDLLQRTHLLDRFSIARLRDLEAAGLLRRSDYEQSLKLTDSERQRRDESYSRLLERMSPEGGDGAPEPPGGSAVPDGDEGEDDAEEASAKRDGDAPPGGRDAAARTAAPEPSDALSDEASTGTSDIVGKSISAVEEPGRVALPGEAGGEPAPDEPPTASDGTEDEPSVAAEASAIAATPAAPPNPARAGRIAASAEQVRRLAHPSPVSPIPVPLPPTAAPPPASAGSASVRTRRLASIYAAQGYWDLAIRVLEDVRRREPSASDLTARLAELRRLKREAAESTRLRASGGRRGS